MPWARGRLSEEEPGRREAAGVQMKRCAVVVGVDKTGGALPHLTAAASGAAEFAEWCRGSQKITATLLTDAGGSKVTVKEICDAIEVFAAQKIYSQLILYFAGHGILKSPGEEYWLLSDAPHRQYEAINVVRSVAFARVSPFRHVVFISDACRTAPVGLQMMGVIGMSVFPNPQRSLQPPKIDELFATAPGDPAYEAKLDDAMKFSGIFTRELLFLLNGGDPAVVVKHENKWVIPTRALEPHLPNRVQASAAKLQVTMNQLPEIRGLSAPPLCLAELANWQPASAPAGSQLPPDEPSPSSVREAAAGLEHARAQAAREREYAGDIGSFIRTSGSGTPRPPRRAVRLASSEAFERAVEEILDTKGREGFESGSGFSVIGSRVLSAAAEQAQCDVFEEAGAYQVRVRPVSEVAATDPQKFRTARSTLIVFGEGTSTVLAAWPGFVGTVLVCDGRVVNVNYTPARHTPEHDAYIRVAPEIDESRAVVAAAARCGRFHLSDEDHDPAEDAAFLRRFKRLDPTLGLYAAYAYAQAGAIDNVRSVLKYMNEDFEQVPFDVALLAGRMRTLHSPFCPMLTQGWAYINPRGRTLPRPVAEAWRHLLPSLWTTFAPAGVASLQHMFSEQKRPS